MSSTDACGRSCLWSLIFYTPYTAQLELFYMFCNILQAFSAVLVLGYTLFAAALFVQVWMLLAALRWEKVTIQNVITHPIVDLIANAVFVDL